MNIAAAMPIYNIVFDDFAVVSLSPDAPDALVSVDDVGVVPNNDPNALAILLSVVAGVVVVVLGDDAGVDPVFCSGSSSASFVDPFVDLFAEQFCAIVLLIVAVAAAISLTLNVVLHITFAQFSLAYELSIYALIPAP